MTEGFDVGLEMSGAESAFNQLLDAMNHGGRVAVLGIPAGPLTLDVNDMIFKGLELQGIYGRRIFETWYKMAAMLQTGLDVSPIITHHFPIERLKRRSTWSPAASAAKSSSTGPDDGLSARSQRSRGRRYGPVADLDPPYRDRPAELLRGPPTLCPSGRRRSGPGSSLSIL